MSTSGQGGGFDQGSGSDRGSGPSRPSPPLEEYRRKRAFHRTSEPRGGGEEGEAPGDREAAAGHDAPGGLAFVVQKHAARRLHYDLRLELDGVLKSWAVPRGPSLDPRVRALAVHVEDHPLEYADFEGTIPADEYGGGTVMLWDRGVWRPREDPRTGYEEGRLAFELYGERLRGEWRLVRMGGEAGEGGRNWLLMKVEDREAQPGAGEGTVETEGVSVATGRTMEEVAREEPPRNDTGAEGGLPPAPEGARSAKLPKTFRPQLPTLVSRPPEGDEWLHELKLDGYRLLARIEDGDVRLLTRRGHDWSHRFPDVAAALARLGASDSIVDGEVVVLRRDGTTDFQALQNVASRGGRERTVYFAFDLPFYRGYDLTELALAERKELLREVLAREPAGGTLRYSDHIEGRGCEVWERACRMALEGTVSKWSGARYREGRQRSWLKVKCLKRQEFVVGGWTEPRGSRSAFGALLLGWYDDGALRYVGRVGTGFTERSLAEVRERLDRIAADEPPFVDPPRGREARGVHWVEPRLVAEVEFGSWTEEGLVRHSAFQGLREDREPEEVRREVLMDAGASEDRNAGPSGAGSPEERRTGGARRPASAEEGGTGGKGPSANAVAGVRISNPGRVLYPDQGVRKIDLARYYETVADWILPHVVDRPLSLVRCPRGRHEACFYQKHLTEGMPEPIQGIPVDEKDGRAIYVGIDDLAGLVTLVQFGVLELHPWGSRADRLDRPDRLIFDLDPGEGVAWTAIVDAAFLVRRKLDDLGLVSFARTTGGKGLHVVAPLVRRAGWEEVKGFARDVAVGFERRDRKRFIATATKARREGRIFVDYLRNGHGATAIASHSTRARPGAPVAVPVRWEELRDLPRSDHYTIESVPRRLARLKADPWEGFGDLRQSITGRMRERVGG